MRSPSCARRPERVFQPDPDPGPTAARDLIGSRSDEDLQELLAIAIHQAAERGASDIYDPLRQIGEGSCSFLAMEIDDWQSAREPDCAMAL